MLPCTIYNYYYSSGETHAVIHLPLVAFGSTTAVFFSTHRKKRKEKKKKKRKRKEKKKKKKNQQGSNPSLLGVFRSPFSSLKS
jgi:phosphate/sulfate permease